MDNQRLVLMAKRDATRFRCVDLPNDQRMWASDDAQRVIVQRAPNRFQAYQLLEGKFHSVGYAASRDDVRRYLKGQAIDMFAWRYDAYADDPPVFTHPALASF